VIVSQDFPQRRCRRACRLRVVEVNVHVRAVRKDDRARNSWLHGVDPHRRTLTIDATQGIDPVRGVLMKPVVKKLFDGINFTPFITEAERRAKLVTV
jgi:hypothetical protein